MSAFTLIWNSSATRPYQQSKIKIISYVVVEFSTRRQIFYVGGLIFYRDPMGTKACITAADLIDSDGNLHCFMQDLIVHCGLLLMRQR